MNRRSAIGTFIGGALAGLFGGAAQEVAAQEDKIGLGYTTYYRGKNGWCLPDGVPGLRVLTDTVVGYQLWGAIDGDTRVRPLAFQSIAPTSPLKWLQQLNDADYDHHLYAVEVYFY